MAVARINHDLRNMLAAAQLISDRLATIPDPLAQRLAPRLVATLDRAILFCQSTLTYGAAREQAPARRPFDLRETVRQVVETAQATSCGAIAYAIEIPPNFELFADPDHVQRTIETLAPAVLRRAGWSPKTLHPGDQISITFVPSKKGTPVGMLRKVVLPDGTELTGGALGEQPQQ